MKKLMVAAVAALAMVGAAQADDTYGYVYFSNYAPVDPSPSTSTESTSKYSCYLVSDDTYKSAAGLQSWLLNNGGVTRDNIVAAGGESASLSAFTRESGHYTAEMPKNHAQLTDALSNNKYAIVLAAATDTDPNFGYTIIRGVSVEVPLGTRWTFNGSSQSDQVGWRAAPEPTSGLLLLLGVAGLCLRRKQK